VHFALTPGILPHALECSVVLSSPILLHEISLLDTAANLQQPAPFFQQQPVNDPVPPTFLGIFEPFGGATEPAAPLFQQQPATNPLMGLAVSRLLEVPVILLKWENGAKFGIR
jgi:hypothetical protein